MTDPPIAILPPSGSGLSPRMERCILGSKVVMFPETMIERTSIFQHVVSKETWESVLTEEDRSRLEAFLPKFPVNDGHEKEETLRRLFGGENFKFGNPLQQFHQKMKDGLLSPEIAKSNHLGRKFRKRDYKFSQQKYYTALLQEVLMNRERTLNLRNGLPPGALLPFRNSPKPDHNKALKDRVKKNYLRTLKEVREECNVEETSSEEEDVASDPVQRSKRQLHRSLGPIPSPEPTTPSVLATFASKPVMNGDITGSENMKRQRAISPVEITDDHYRQMLKRHKRRKLDSPTMPELDTEGVTLQDILSRCQAAGKKTVKTAMAAAVAATNGDVVPEGTDMSMTPSSAKKKPARPRDKGDNKKVKRKPPVKTEKMEIGGMGNEHMTLPQPPPNLDMHSDLLTHRDDDGVPDFPLPDTLPARLTMGQADSFFSLLRDIICDFPDSKATTAKVEERVREWQESPASSLNPWLHHQQNWVECVVSALKFLSGDVLGLSVENFVPFLDYKERAQQWKWIGVGRDSNQQLSPLFRHWLNHRNAPVLDGLTSSHGSPPPVRAKTNFVVRPTSAAEKGKYQEQECRRFENPHKAFTYQLHGYDSVVGPVKGVYNKENAVTKAREHNLLVSDRPAFVTILTLVRDAAARLPNGEGTRGDICELLKDSQFLAPGVTDTQVNTVVSGALDRLHSEKDPCVKYDVNSKLWIYLHRSRTEDEFERIHQAQGAAAKAKKSLQRPKASKAIKDHMSQSTATTVKAALAATAASASASAEELDSLASIMTAISTPSPVGPSPKAARTSKAKQNAAAKAAAAAALAAAAATTANIITTTVATAAASPAPAATVQTPVTTPARKPAAKARSRPTVVSVAAGSTAASLLASRAQTTATLLTQSNGNSLLTGKPATMHPAAITVTKPPVVTVTSKGLTPSSKISNVSVGEVGSSTGNGNSGGARNSPILLTQDPGSRSSTPTAVGTPPPTVAKLVTLAQSGNGGGSVLVSGAGDNAVITRLVQQVASGQQVVSVGNLPAGARALAHAGQQRATTLKIQGGNIVQPVIGGKPMHLTGKPLLQLSGKGAQPLSVIQTSHGQISTLSLIPQTLPSVQVSAASMGAKVAVAANSSNSSPVTLAMVSSGSPGGKSVVLTSSASQLQSQAKVVTPSQAGMVVTQLAQGISIRPGLPGAQQGKMMATGQGLVPAQFIVQQGPGPNANQGTPIIVSQAGGKGTQNIQVVRTVLSQQGIKPGQATILISQPALQQATQAGNVISSAQVIHTGHAPGAGGGIKGPGRGSPKGKSQPVYARIIQPPTGIKLTTVGGQVTAGQSTSVLQTVSKLLGMTGSQVTATAGAYTSSSPAVVVTTNPMTTVQAGQSLLKSQVSDSANADINSTDAKT